MKFAYDTPRFRVFDTPTIAGKKFRVYLPFTHLVANPVHGKSMPETYMGVIEDPTTIECCGNPMNTPLREPCTDMKCGCKKPTPRKKKPTRRKTSTRRTAR